jgi:hypothetical protein
MPNGNGATPDPAPVTPFNIQATFAVLPQATGFSWQYDPSGGAFPIRLIVTTGVGISVYCLDADVAQKVGDGLVQVAQQARTGLLIAKAGDLPARKPEEKP